MSLCARLFFCLLLAALDLQASTAPDVVGPFQHVNWLLDPAASQPATTAADGSHETAFSFGTASAGILFIDQWSGISQGAIQNAHQPKPVLKNGGNSLLGPASKTFWLGLAGWENREGFDDEDGWFYYPKYQQDAEIRLGYVDADQSAIAMTHGTSFGLGQALPWNAVVVSLPYHWIQGGGASWQRTYASGNPIQAGVWQIPAGKTLSVAQADSNNRLADISALLGELPPDKNHPAFRFLVQSTGEWSLQVDFDSNGASDVDLLSSQTGNKPASFAMPHPSGLLVTTRAAQGASTGTLIHSFMGLTYRATDRIAPTSPKDQRPLAITIPLHSRSSPVHLEGEAWSSARTVTAMSGSTPLPVDTIAGTRIHLDVPLTKSAPTAVKLSQLGTPPTEVAGSISWDPTDLYYNEKIYIKVGDRVLLTFHGSCGTIPTVGIDANGDGKVDYSGPSSSLFAYRYSIAGVYAATAIVDGKVRGKATIIVSSVVFPKNLAAQVGYNRQVDVVVSPGSANTTYFTSSDSAALTVTKGQVNGASIRLTAKLLKRGIAYIQARAGSATGPIIATKDITGFTFDTEAKEETMIDDGVGNGTGELIMRPYVPNVIWHLQMFAHRSTFGCGLKSLTALTSSPAFTQSFDPIDNAVNGHFKFTIEMPSNEDSYCFKIKAGQVNSPEQDITNESNNNGKKCAAKVDHAVMFPGEVKPDYQVHRTKGVKGGHDHPIYILNNNANTTPASPFFTNADKFPCDNAMPKDITKPVSADGAVKGHYDVAITTTVFPDAIIVTKIKLKLSVVNGTVPGEDPTANVQSNDAFNLRVTAIKEDGSTATNYRGTVHFTTSGSGALPADYTFTASDSGTHLFSAVIIVSTSGCSPAVDLTGTDIEDSTITGTTSPFLWFFVTSTREGLVGGTTADGHTIIADDHFVALPSRKCLGSAVRLKNGGAVQVTTQRDVGPWNENDPYWTGSGEPLSLTSPSGSNHAGIDLADGTFAALGNPNSVYWRFE